jgi:hypothetical protein
MHCHRIGPDRKAPPPLVRQPVPSDATTRPPGSRRYRTRGLRLPLYEAALITLADRVRRLAPRHGDPEAFHLEKSEIEHALRRLAAQGPL